MSSKHSPPISTHSASETTKAPGDSPRRRCLTAATRFTAASSASTSSTRRRLRNSSPEIASPACPVSVGSSARKMIRPGPLSPLAAFTPRVSSFHRSWSLLPPAMITSTSDGKALRMRGFLVLRALPQQSAQRPPATTSRTATHRSRSERTGAQPPSRYRSLGRVRPDPLPRLAGAWRSQSDARASAETVKLRDDELVAGALCDEQRLVQLWASGELAAGVVDEDPLASGSVEGVVLSFVVLIARRHAPVADPHATVPRTGES